MKNRLKLFLPICLLLALLITSCQSIEQKPSIPPSSSPTPITLPEADKSTVTGQLVSQKDRSPIRDTVIHLAEVHIQGDEGAYVLDSANSPGAFTDQEGKFVVDNITPGQYVLVIGDPMSNYSVVSDADGKVRTWETAAGQILDMNQILTDFVP